MRIVVEGSMDESSQTPAAWEVWQTALVLVRELGSPAYGGGKSLRTRCEMKPCAAGTRCAARCFVLSRPDMSHIGAPCVLAAHSRTAPRRRSVIPQRVLKAPAVAVATASLRVTETTVSG